MTFKKTCCIISSRNLEFWRNLWKITIKYAEIAENIKPIIPKNIVILTDKDHGFCAKHEKIVEKQGTCAFWRSNLFRRKMRKKVAIRALNDILTNLSEIRQILGEDEKEE